jgi:predicted RNase H-like HicB family nuclease
VGNRARTHGKTYEEAAKNARKVLELLIGSHDQKSEGPVPPPKLFHYPGADVVNVPEKTKNLRKRAS